MANVATAPGDSEGDGALELACNWTSRCQLPGDHPVWTAATGQLVTRRVCGCHLVVALAISYRQGTPPAPVVP